MAENIRTSWDALAHSCTIPVLLLGYDCASPVLLLVGIFRCDSCAIFRYYIGQLWCKTCATPLCYGSSTAVLLSLGY